MHSLRLLIFVAFVATPSVLYAAGDTTTFTFNLNDAYTTSAGVYKPDGTLVRTLWRKVVYGPGPTTKTWNNRDDAGTLVPAGTYQIKVLYHNTQYVFEGMIGNTSSPSSGTSVFHGMNSMHNIAISGNFVFFTNGVNEGRQTIHSFNTAFPGQQIDIGHKDFYVSFEQVAADESKVYFACHNSGFFADWPPQNQKGGDPIGDGYHTFVVAFSTTFNSASGVFDAVPFPSPAGVNLNTNLAPNFDDEGNGDTYWPGVIDVDQDYWPFPNGANYKAPTGIAVQTATQGNGNVLAVAHGGLNVVRLFDKNTGVFLRPIPVANPQGLAMSPDGSLWVISGATVVNYSGPHLTEPGGEKDDPTLVVTASADLDLPVAIAVSAAGWLVVADAGAHQQIKFFSPAGTPIPSWTYGQRGGYATNGPDIAADKFGFQVNRKTPINHNPLALQPDGTIWIGDGATNRLLHYSIPLTGSPFVPITPTIMYFGAYGTSTADAHEPTRVIGDGFLEFEVDYNAPIGQGWTLKKNWAADLPPKYFHDGGAYAGLRSMMTFKVGHEYGLTSGNGRTYALLTDFTDEHREIVELPASGPLRRTGISLARRDRYPGCGSFGTSDVSLESDGSLRYHQIIENTVYWRQTRLMGFEENGNPVWDWVNEPTTPAYASATNLDPIAGAGTTRYPITSSNVLVAFDANSENTRLPPCAGGPRIDHLGWHLGGLSLTPGNNHHWLWRVSPTIVDTDVDGLGSFLVEHSGNITRPYAGTTVMASGRNIVYGYHEEFYHGDGNASQWMHFYDDGLFVGQFGTPYDPSHEVTLNGAVPGSTALMYHPSMVTVDANNDEAAPGTGETYLWTNTLSSHSGVPRWHMVGANQIQETVGMVSLGGTVNLVNPTPTFPTGLKAAPGNGQVALSWTNAPSPNYTLKVSTTSFGPAIQTFSGTSGESHTFTGLTNDSSSSPLAPYYIRIGGGTSSVSNEVIAYPFNLLGRCGQLYGGPFYPWQVSSEGVSHNTPSLSGISSVVGNLALTSVGSKGYVIYGWQIQGNQRIDKTNLNSQYHVDLGLGWTTQDNGSNFTFVEDGVPSAKAAIKANETPGVPGTVSITVPTGDTSVHYLTVFSPAIGNGDSQNRVFQVKLERQQVPIPPPAIYSNNSLGKHNRIYQFEFIGNVTLTMSRMSPHTLALQAIFLD